MFRDNCLETITDDGLEFEEFKFTDTVKAAYFY